MSILTERLQAAQRAVRKPQGNEEALRLVLEAWREVPHPRLVALVERLDNTLKRRPLGQASLKAMNARWLEVAKARDPIDVPRLLAALTTGRAQATLGRLRELAQFPNDPRTAMALASLLAEPPFEPGVAMTQMVELVGGLLVRMAHPETLVTLAAHRTRPEIETVCLAIEGAVQPPRELDAAEESLCTQLDAALPETRVADALLDAIYTAPDDHGLRSVYADWLVERGDPRGEFIHLQLAAARGQLSPDGAYREAELLRLHARNWLGPLTKVIPTGERVFERGFLQKCTVVTPNRRTFIAVASAPEWRTVSELTCNMGYQQDAHLFASRDFAHLESLRGPHSQLLVELAKASAPRRLRHAGVIITGPDGLAEMAEAFREGGPGLPELRSLRCASQPLPAEAFAGLLASALGQRLDALEVCLQPQSVRQLLSSATPTSILRLQVMGPPTRHWEIVARRESPRAQWILEPPDLTPQQLTNLGEDP